ncbi:MAG: hypothetical protein ACUVXD_04340 [Thermodesulfobacteriota bacterium]
MIHPRDPDHYLGKRTLIVGDVNTGKTALTREILHAMCERGWGREILVLDLAPIIPAGLALRAGLEGVGGRLPVPEGSHALYMRPVVMPPRLSGKTQEEAVALAEGNRLAIEGAMKKAARRHRDILFLNDLTLYLQAGSAVKLSDFLGRFGTVVANGYMGERLGGGELSTRETSEMEALLHSFDRLVRLGGSGEIRVQARGGKILPSLAEGNGTGADP